jgi:Zn-dependent M28 family amino/carboxypeptidase
MVTRPGVEGPFLVLCGHLDSVKNTPGADDNASSVAVLLEVASTLVRSELPIMIALLDMEAVGHSGAKALARRMSAEGSAATVINMDMVGFFSTEPRSQKLPLGRITSPSAARDLRARDYNRGLSFQSAYTSRSEPVRGSRSPCTRSRPGCHRDSRPAPSAAAATSHQRSLASVRSLRPV